MEHIDESAELYALGLLEPRDRARIDDHVANCAACLRRLGDAEGAVTALALASQRVAQRRGRWPLAIAAALALTSGTLFAQNIALRGALADDGSTVSALVQSHFAHAQFRTPSGSAVDAKAIYERHGAWIDVVTTLADPGRVRMIRSEGSPIVVDRPLARRGSAAELFVRAPAGVREIQLIDARGATTAFVRLVDTEPR